MFATVGTKPVRHQRVKQALVAALLTLSLGLGMATIAQPMDANAAPHLNAAPPPPKGPPAIPRTQPK